MSDPTLPHVDVAGWLLGDLDADEERRTAEHLATCVTCRAEVDALRGTADRVLSSGPTATPPPGLELQVLEAVAAAAAEREDDAEEPDQHIDDPITDSPSTRARDAVTGGPVADRTPSGAIGGAPTTPREVRPPGRRADDRREAGRASRWRRPVALLAVAAVAVAAFVVGSVTTGRPPGELELQAQLASTDGATTAEVTVRRLTTGRAVDVTSTTLPILPDGGLYELWFVGPGDTTETPNRISAGTFHPDEDGNTQVELHAAVVPDAYPTVVITAEPNNGDPAPNGPEVVRSPG